MMSATVTSSDTINAAFIATPEETMGTSISDDQVPHHLVSEVSPDTKQQQNVFREQKYDIRLINA